MIDTHSHIYSKQFATDTADMLQRAQEAGVKRIYMPNIDVGTIAAMNALAEQHNWCFPMMGLHPSHVKEDWEERLAMILQELHNNPQQYVGVGEIGIDLYWDKTFIDGQKRAFAQQIEASLQHNLPIVIHCRDAFDEVFEVLEKFRNTNMYGIFHCFTGNLEQAKHALDLNLKLGIGGVVTFKNGGLDKVVAQLSLDDLVLETDAPYLAPAPHRGKRNEPAYTKLVANKLSDIFEVSLEEVDHITTTNALQIFEKHLHV
jgi:TatD DNase family protein